MAYRFTSATGARVKFAISPLQGYTFGAGTFAAFLKRSATGLGVAQAFIPLTDSSNGNKVLFYFGNDDTIRVLCSSNVTDGTVNDTTNWLLLAVSFPASGTARFHIHNGTSWAHTNASSVGSIAVIGATDKLLVGCKDDLSLGFDGDIVCAGIKKANSTDGQIETLTRTAFQSWRDFGFDWLIGFDSSQESAGILQDQASPGTGDEIAITSTSAVSDPAGWAWVALAPVADFTGTPTSGAASLSVAFTDSSTNTPTSWAWDFGDGSTSTSQNPTHSYTSSGVYTVTLTATNASGSNTKTRTGYITVTEPVVYASGGGIDIW